MKKEVTLKEHIENFFINEVKTLVYNEPKHLIIATNVICTGIELLGKICDENVSLDESGHSRQHFENAVQKFISLNKYGSIKDKDEKCALYTDVRCRFSHGLMNGEYINLTESMNEFKTKNGKTFIGIIELYEDFVKACNELLSDNNFNIQTKLNEKMYDVVWNLRL